MWSRHLSRSGLRSHVMGRQRLSSLVPSRLWLSPNKESALATTPSPQFVFVGGKGGVGKTTTAAALALSLASHGHRTLIVSTDPAHSLGDAFDQPTITRFAGRPVPLQSNQTMKGSLDAMEIDLKSALSQFRSQLSQMSPHQLASQLQVPVEMINALGLQELVELLSELPPGIDEVVAILQIFRYANLDSNVAGSNRESPYDRIVIDTAPTGHTIRLMKLPEKIGFLLTRLLRWKSRVENGFSSLKRLIGSRGDSDKQFEQLEKLLNILESFQRDVDAMQRVLLNRSQTQFAVVTIPTELAVYESERLLNSLRVMDVQPSMLVVNQLLPTTETSQSESLQWLMRRQHAQCRITELLNIFVKTLRSSPSSSSKNQLSEVTVKEVPLLDEEVRGVHGLRYFASNAHGDVSKDTSRKFTMFGGKGGVGKTTCAASYAVKLADSGLRTLVISSDPAHSLGDALMENLSGTPRAVDFTANGGELWAMEIDPAKEMKEFLHVMEKMSGGSRGGMQSSIMELLLDTNNPPPGIDEIIAMAKVMRLMEEGFEVNGKMLPFDRIVLDTAPTGHTLRMLSLPDMMDRMLSRMQALTEKTSNAMNAFRLGSGGKQSNTKEMEAMADYKIRLERFRRMLHDTHETEFSVVTIPTSVALQETIRLLESLQVSLIDVRRVLVNQVLPSPEEDSERLIRYLDRRQKGQNRAMEKLEEIAEDHHIPLVQVPMFDEETKSIYGIQEISRTIFDQIDTLQRK